MAAQLTERGRRVEGNEHASTRMNRVNVDDGD